MGHSCVGFKAFILYISLTLQAFAGLPGRLQAILAGCDSPFGGVLGVLSALLLTLFGHNPATQWTPRAGY